MGGFIGAWTVVAGHMARMCMGSVRSSSETDRVGVKHFKHARGAQYWHSTRSGAADREEQGIGVPRVMASRRVGNDFIFAKVVY